MSQSKRRGGLGRGLASLIPTGPADGGPRLGDAAADVVIGVGPAGGVAAQGIAEIPAITEDIGAVYREISPTDIEPNPRQPRQVFDDEALAELVHSIREFGLMQPIVVREVEASASGRRYQLVMGSGVGGLPSRPASPPSRRSFGRPPKPTCSGMHCWRTSTGHS